MNNILQLISDEIICHKKAIEDVEEKLNLLSFLNDVDNYMGRSFNLDKEDLVSRRKELEGRLKKLISKKVELTGRRENPKTNIVNKSKIAMNNYLSINNYQDIQPDKILGIIE